VLKLLTVFHVKVLSRYRKQETVKTTKCYSHDNSLKAQNRNQHVRSRNRDASHSNANFCNATWWRNSCCQIL